MTTTTDTTAARAELARLLSEAGWTYHRAMCRFDWQMGWSAKRDAFEPPVETLTADQIQHLCDLIRGNLGKFR